MSHAVSLKNVPPEVALRIKWYVHKGMVLNSASPGLISEQLNQNLEVGPGYQKFSKSSQGDSNGHPGLTTEGPSVHR